MTKNKMTFEDLLFWLQNYTKFITHRDPESTIPFDDYYDFLNPENESLDNWSFALDNCNKTVFDELWCLEDKECIFTLTEDQTRDFDFVKEKIKELYPSMIVEKTKETKEKKKTMKEHEVKINGVKYVRADRVTLKESVRKIKEKEKIIQNLKEDNRNLEEMIEAMELKMDKIRSIFGGDLEDVPF